MTPKGSSVGPGRLSQHGSLNARAITGQRVFEARRQCLHSPASPTGRWFLRRHVLSMQEQQTVCVCVSKVTS